jgi:hypothetical protein
MTKQIDELMALIQATIKLYAYHATDDLMVVDDGKAINIIRIALEAALKPGDMAKAWSEGYRRGIDDERTSASNIGIAGFNAKVEPARHNPYGDTPPAQTPLEIHPPNGSGETMCVVRWMAETPHGWVGSFDREALEQFNAPPAQTPAYINQAEAESHGYLSQPVTIRNPVQTPPPRREPLKDTLPSCNTHPDAPHGCNRTASLSLRRYVCDCEGWTP